MRSSSEAAMTKTRKAEICNISSRICWFCSSNIRTSCQKAKTTDGPFSHPWSVTECHSSRLVEGSHCSCCSAQLPTGTAQNQVASVSGKRAASQLRPPPGGPALLIRSESPKVTHTHTCMHTAAEVDHAADSRLTLTHFRRLSLPSRSGRTTGG